MLRRALELLLLVGIIYGASIYVQRALDREPAVSADAPQGTRAPLAAHTPEESTNDAPSAKAEAPQVALGPVAGLRDDEAARMHHIHKLFATGDFVGALRAADLELERDDLSPAFHSWILAQMPVLLTSAGWARLRLGDCDEAITYLRRSESLRRSPETAKGLAVCHFKQRSIAAAREQFVYYLERHPQDRDMQILHADVLESEGRYDEAVTALEMASTQGAHDEELETRLSSMRGRAKESSHQLVETSRNFRLSYRARDHEDLVSFVLGTLEDALDEYVENFDFKLPVAPIEVALYPAQNFQSVVAGGPEWAEGIFDGRVRIPVRDHMSMEATQASLRVVLRHELVHALLALMSDHRTLPPWFEEGLAQRLSCRGSDCGRFRFPVTPGVFLQELAFQTSYISLPPVSAGRAYQQSLYLVLALERLRGSDILRRVIRGITTSSDLSSDALLSPARLSFPNLREYAATRWAAGDRLAGAAQ